MRAAQAAVVLCGFIGGICEMETVYEVINLANNAVINRIVLENPGLWEPPAGQAIRLFIAPDPPEFSEPPAPAPLTPLAFLRRFTAQERITIRACPYPIVQDFLLLIDVAQDIRVDDPDTIAGVHYLAQQGLIASARVAEILTAD